MGRRECGRHPGRALAKVQALYRTEKDPGLHAAAEWLLWKWKQEAWLKQVNEDWAKDREKRDKRLVKIQELPQITGHGSGLR